MWLGKDFTLFASIFSILFIFSTVLCASEISKSKFTKDEHLALAKLRNLTKDLHDTYTDEYYHTDTFLMRWLRASDLDVVQASEMIHETDKWRRENRIDNILNEKIFDFKSPAYNYTGHDNEGRPIVFLTPTHLDLRKFILSGKRDSVIRYWDQMLERGFYGLRNATNNSSTGDEITQFNAILDVTGFNLRQHFCLECAGVYVEWIQHFENYYPDALKYFILINMNRLAVPFVEVIRPFMSTPTQKAFKVFGTYRPEWEEFLRSIIPLDQLPYRFGGKNH